MKTGKNISVRGPYFPYLKMPILPIAALKECKLRYRNHAVLKCIRNWRKKIALQLSDEVCIHREIDRSPTPRELAESRIFRSLFFTRGWFA